MEAMMGYAHGAMIGGLACMVLACACLVRTAWGKR